MKKRYEEAGRVDKGLSRVRVRQRESREVQVEYEMESTNEGHVDLFALAALRFGLDFILTSS